MNRIPVVADFFTPQERSLVDAIKRRFRDSGSVDVDELRQAQDVCRAAKARLEVASKCLPATIHPAQGGSSRP